MPFGLTNAPGTFQLLMQQVLKGLENYSLPYSDDITEEAPHTCGWGGQNIRDWHTPMKSDF